MTRTTNVTWHHGIVLEDGTPYPLRHRLSARALDLPELNDIALGLSEQDRRTSTAVHELAHAVLWLTHGIHVVRLGVGIGPGGEAECAPPPPDLYLEWAIAIAAGERAQDRWLRETGLWTEDLAAMAELGASRDRSLVFAADPEPRPGFGDGGPDYADLHTLADQALDEQWGVILAAVPALVQEGQMSGSRLAARIGIANPAPMPVQAAS